MGQATKLETIWRSDHESDTPARTVRLVSMRRVNYARVVYRHVSSFGNDVDNRFARLRVYTPIALVQELAVDPVFYNTSSMTARDHSQAAVLRR